MDKYDHYIRNMHILPPDLREKIIAGPHTGECLTDDEFCSLLRDSYHPILEDVMDCAFMSELLAIREYIGWGHMSNRNIDSLCEMDKPILEVGCGTGYYSAVLRARGVDVIAVDNQSWRRHFSHKHTDIIYDDAAKYVANPGERVIFASWPDMHLGHALLKAPMGHSMVVLGPQCAFGNRELTSRMNGDWRHLELSPHHFDEEIQDGILVDGLCWFAMTDREGSELIDNTYVSIKEFKKNMGRTFSGP